MAKASSAHGLSGDNNSGGILARPVDFLSFPGAGRVLP